MFTRTIKGQKVEAKAISSLTQCRLDVLTQPLPEHANAVIATREKIWRKPHVYHSDVLEDRLEHLGRRIEGLEPSVYRPTPDTSPEDWLNSKRRLARLEGERFAIRLALDGNTCGGGSVRSSSTPAPVPEDWTNDPFADQ